MRKIKTKDIFITGFAIFAMFLGAGNLIFPPHIGINAGNMYVYAMMGFTFTGIIMTLMGLIATANTGGNIQTFSSVLSRRFALIFNILVLLCIGPLLAIPRTAATTYEVGIVPIFGELEWGTIFGAEVSRIVVGAVYFLLNYFLVIRPSGIIDIIGKYFTPALMVLLLGIIIKGVMDPIGVPGEPQVTNAFALGFKEGYQTMDAMGSIAMGGIAIAGLKKLSSNEEEVRKSIILSSIIAAIGLFVVYGGFIYLGATGSIVFKNIARSQATVQLVEAIGSTAGKVALSVAMVFACFTTSMALITTISTFFHELLGDKHSYKSIVIVVTVVSYLISIAGVNKIVVFAEPILNTFYPTTIVLIILNLFRSKIKNKYVYRGAAYGATFAGFVYALSGVLKKGNILERILAYLPLGSDGFMWIYFAVIGAILMVTIKGKQDNCATC